MPLHGYTRMFERMLDHPNIKRAPNTDYREVRTASRTTRSSTPGRWTNSSASGSGGSLPLAGFEPRRTRTERFQPAAVVNYPNDHPYTRVTEFKYLTGQGHPKTAVVYEYPRAEGDPYYPSRGRRTRRSTSGTRRWRERRGRRALRRTAGDLPLLQHGPGGGAGPRAVPAIAARGDGRGDGARPPPPDGHTKAWLPGAGRAEADGSGGDGDAEPRRSSSVTASTGTGRRSRPMTWLRTKRTRLSLSVRAPCTRWPRILRPSEPSPLSDRRGACPRSTRAPSSGAPAGAARRPLAVLLRRRRAL